MEAWIGLENSLDVSVVRMERAVDRILTEGFGYSLVRIGDFGTAHWRSQGGTRVASTGGAVARGVRRRCG